jgi:hypothetical protein
MEDVTTVMKKRMLDGYFVAMSVKLCSVCVTNVVQMTQCLLLSMSAEMRGLAGIVKLTLNHCVK